MNTGAETSNQRQIPAPPSPSSGLPHDAHAIRRILVCVDNSPSSGACLRHAAAISRSLGSAITILHVLEAPHERSVHATDVLDWELSRQEANAHL